MNIYFLVEGKRTEKKVYPKWLSHLIPELSEIRDPFTIDHHQFYVFNGNGFPSILNNHLRNSVEDVNTIGKFDYLVMCIDAEEFDVQERTDEVFKFIEKENIQLNDDTKFVLIIQNRCIETWCLGNRKVFKRNAESEQLRAYIDFFDISTNDPEMMGKTDNFETHAQFHAAYLREMLLERNIYYTKKHPRGVTEKSYLEELIKRTTKTDQIQTFRAFLEFCKQVKREI